MRRSHAAAGKASPVAIRQLECSCDQSVGMIAAGLLCPFEHRTRSVERQHPAVRKSLQQGLAKQPLAGAEFDQQAARRRWDQVGDHVDLALAFWNKVAPVVQKAAGIFLGPVLCAFYIRHDAFPRFSIMMPEAGGSS
ncbi:hypothetical protein EH240_17630 [Mesorhizobium tamadayense]|uniref:Uncharacterized protein n=1 Tax=Mesorhizobium tamadayense TaxID=425306 RepID=A0A3P3FP22_9HYPH|nr:hypothetical protein [Mesorhizobium tamadayense]RRI00158.1 hypothetical protein EH240_17630 [Mesorhizobium tamadayense]